VQSGANVAGAAMKENSLGTVGNSIAGIVGGGLGGTLLQMVMGSAATGGGSMDLTSILSNVAGGGVGGAVLMAIIGFIKNKMAAKYGAYASRTPISKLKLSRVQSAGARKLSSADKTGKLKQV